MVHISWRDNSLPDGHVLKEWGWGMGTVQWIRRGGDGEGAVPGQSGALLWGAVVVVLGPNSLQSN